VEYGALLQDAPGYASAYIGVYVEHLLDTVLIQTCAEKELFRGSRLDDGIGHSSSWFVQ